MVNAVPLTPSSSSSSEASGKKNIKPATPDIIQFDDDTQLVEELADLFFQQLGGRELINLTNKDIINSINPNISIISNLFKINIQYDPKNLIPLFNPSNEIINNYALKFNDYVPEYGTGTGPNGEIVYIDNEGNLIINGINLLNNEKIEVEILNDGSVFDATIYKEENT